MCLCKLHWLKERAIAEINQRSLEMPDAFLYQSLSHLHRTIRVHLHHVSALTLRQLCNDASDSVLIENNGVALGWGYNPFSSDSIVLNDIRIASVIAELSQH